MKETFTVTLSPDGSFEVPLDVKAVFGQARAPVMMTVCGETFRTRVAVYGGKSILGLWKAVLEKHGLRGGERLEVTLEPDTAERVVTPPTELLAAMKKDAKVRAGWEAMSFTHQREWAEAIVGAKKPETREKRVAAAVSAMIEKATQTKAARTKRAARP